MRAERTTSSVPQMPQRGGGQVSWRCGGFDGVVGRTIGVVALGRPSTGHDPRKGRRRSKHLIVEGGSGRCSCAYPLAYPLAYRGKSVPFGLPYLLRALLLEIGQKLVLVDTVDVGGIVEGIGSRCSTCSTSSGIVLTCFAPFAALT